MRKLATALVATCSLLFCCSVQTVVLRASTVSKNSPADEAASDSATKVIVSARHLNHAKAIRSIIYKKEAPNLPDITVQRFQVTEPAEYKGRVFTLKILAEFTYPLEKSDHFVMAIPLSCVEKKEPDKNCWKFSDLVMAENW